MKIYGSKVESRADIEKAASSRTINKTIRDIEALMKGNPLSSSSDLRIKLHDKIYELLQSEAKYWYRRGFKRGHKTVARKFKNAPKDITAIICLRGGYFGRNQKLMVLSSKIKE
ncbi:MAG: hypothetical protein M1508_05320 [Nitrospirae bacterium]|nr:hypothetical protein [Nitrospirota bacterium]MCL5422167.1 hypothetical protein [Nitrospirota bacterium]